MPELTPKSIIEEEIPKRIGANVQLQKDINAVFVFDIGGEYGGKWTMDLTKSSDWIKPGIDATPKMTIKISDKDFVALCTKKLNPQMAALMGKLKFSPMDMGVAMKLAKLLG